MPVELVIPKEKINWTQAFLSETELAALVVSNSAET